MPDDVKAVLFDVDNTLFDRDRAQREVCSLIISEFNDLFSGMDRDRITKAFLLSDEEATRLFAAGGGIETSRTGRSRRFLAILGLNQDYAEQINRAYVRAYPLVDAPVDGAKAAVQQLADTFYLGVVSNGIPDVQYRK
ncbi:MAG: HAD family hydrolase, partial [Candidatus Zixiibacteriota bacterium]